MLPSFSKRPESSCNSLFIFSVPPCVMIISHFVFGTSIYRTIAILGILLYSMLAIKSVPLMGNGECCDDFVFKTKVCELTKKCKSKKDLKIRGRESWFFFLATSGKWRYTLFLKI